MFSYRVFFTVLIFTLIVGCAAAPGPNFEPLVDKPNEAVLYVYRPSKMRGSGTYPHIYVDGIEKSPLKNGGYIALYLPPGEHVILSKGKDWKWDLPDSSVKLTVTSGETYFVKLDYDLDIGFSDSGKDNSQKAWAGSAWVVNYGAGFHPVSEQDGKNEISALKLSY